MGIKVDRTVFTEVYITLFFICYLISSDGDGS